MTRAKEQSVQLVGRSYAINTIGAISGAFAAGFVLIPKLSTRFTILCAAALCIVVAGAAYVPKADARERDPQRAVAAGLTLVLIVLLFVVAPRVQTANPSNRVHRLSSAKRRERPATLMDANTSTGPSKGHPESSSRALAQQSAGQMPSAPSMP